MKLLLDTHIVIWAALDHPLLPPTAAEMITDPRLLEWSHRDPFDRMLGAQALVEDLALVTVDTAFDHDVCRLALPTET